MADRAPITTNAEGLAKAAAAAVPNYIIGRDVLERVTSLQSIADYIDVLTEIVDRDLRALKEMIGQSYAGTGIANWGEWDRLETMLSLIMVQGDIVKNVSEATELAYIATEVAA